MHQHRIVATKFNLHLTHRFHEWQAFNITDSTTNFNHRNIVAFAAGTNTRFDFIGNMRNDLYRATQIITATFFLNHCRINTPAGKVVALRHF